MAAQAIARLTVSAGVFIKTILFATDFSPCATQALPFATALARRYQAAVLLTHVIEAEARLPIPPEPLYARDNMRQLQQSQECKGISHEALLMCGELWPVLSDIVARRGVDLIVAGTHGREGIRKLLLGSFAEEIFRHASCPVLLVGPYLARPAPRFERILYATDFSLGSLQALPYALLLAQAPQAQLTLLHVVAPEAYAPVELWSGNYPCDVLGAVEKRLRDLIPDSVALPSPPQVRVERGFAAENILGFAVENKSDLIIMGVHSGGAAATHLPWTIAHRVVCHAPCAVMTVRGE